MSDAWRDSILEHCLLDFRITDESPGRLTASGVLSVRFSGFEGHFPGQPLLAGAFQIELLSAISRGLLEETWVPSSIEHARFRKMVRPGDSIELRVNLASREPGRAKVKASLYRGAEKACQATLVFTAV